MNELYKIAARYYTKQESYSAYGIMKNIYFWLLLMIISLFIYSVINRPIKLIAFLKSEPLYLIITLLILEIFVITILALNDQYRDKRIKEGIEKELKRNFNSLMDAKVAYLKYLLSCTQSDFRELAKDLQGMLKLSQQYHNNQHVVNKISNFIFNSEAKQRILALFILLSSIITIISVSGGANLEILISIFEQNKFEKILKGFIVIFVIVVFLMSMLIVVYKVVREMLIYFSLFFSKENSQSTIMVEYLIADLNKYHTFKKVEKKKAENKLFKY